MMQLILGDNISVSVTKMNFLTFNYSIRQIYPSRPKNQASLLLMMQLIFGDNISVSVAKMNFLTFNYNIRQIYTSRPKKCVATAGSPNMAACPMKFLVWSGRPECIFFQVAHCKDEGEKNVIDKNLALKFTNQISNSTDQEEGRERGIKRGQKSCYNGVSFTWKKKN